MKHETETTDVREVDLSDVRSNSLNPSARRKRTSALRELESSIRDHGLLQPVVLRQLANGGYEVVAGDRRTQACRNLGLEFIRATVLSELDDDTARGLTLVENLHREDLDPFDEAELLREAVESGGLTIRELAAQLDRTTDYLSRRLSLGNLSAKARKLAEPTKDRNAWPIGHLELLATLEPVVQDEVVDEYRHYTAYPTRKRLVEVVSAYCRELSQAPWDISDESLLPKAGPCVSCTKTSGRRPTLFVDDEGADASSSRCLDGLCWIAKTRAHRERAVLAALEKHQGARLVDTNEPLGFSIGSARRRSVPPMSSPPGTTFDARPARRARSAPSSSTDRSPGRRSGFDSLLAVAARRRPPERRRVSRPTSGPTPRSSGMLGSDSNRSAPPGARRSSTWR